MHICSALRDYLCLGTEEVESCARELFPVLDTDKVRQGTDLHEMLLQNNMIDALEFLATLVAVSGMNIIEKVQFIFDLYDFGECGALVLDELTLLLKSTVIGLTKISGDTPPSFTEFEKLAKIVFASELTVNGRVVRNLENGTKLPQAKFVTYCTHNPTLSSWLEYYDDLAPAAITTEPGPDFAGVIVPPRTAEYARRNALHRLNVVSMTEQIDEDKSQEALTEQPKPGQDADLQPARSSRPGIKVALEWAYGYGAAGSRQNVYYTQGGDIVWHAGEVGIVYTPQMEDRKATQQFMTAHSDLIVCLATSSDGRLCATGEVGERPKVVVWDTSNIDGGSLSVFVGYHARAVVAIAFSRDNTLLASLDAGEPSAKLAVHQVAQNGARVFATRLPPGSRVHDVAWSMQASTFVTVGNAHVKFWVAPSSGDAKTRHRHFVAKNGVSLSKEVSRPRTYTAVVAAGNADGLTMISGSTMGEIFLWRGRNCVSIQDGAHGTAAVTALHAPLDKSMRAELVASAGAHGLARVWRLVADDSQLQVIVQIDLMELGISGSASAVCLHVSGERILVGTTDSEIYELHAVQPSQQCDGESGEVLVGKPVSGGDGPFHCGPGAAAGLACVAASSATNRFIVCSKDGGVTIWDDETRKIEKRDKILPSAATVAAFAPDGSKVALGLDKGAVHIFEIKDFALLNSVELASSAITDLKWSKNVVGVAAGSLVELLEPGSWTKKLSCECPAAVTGIDIAGDEQLLRASCSDGCLVGYSTETGEKIPPAQLQEVRWETRTAYTADGAQGVVRSAGGLHLLPKYTATDSIIACADEFGSIHVFNYPCVNGKALFITRFGHAPGIAGLCFLTPTRLLTAGGLDGAVFAWSLEPQEDEPDDDGVVEGTEPEDDEEDGDTTTAVLTYDALVDKNVADDPRELDYAEKSSLFKIIRRGDYADDTSQAGKQTYQSEISPPRRGFVTNDELEIDWIHGYSGQSQRNNVRYAGSGEIVYPAACAACVLAKTTRTQRRLIEHTDEISSLAMSGDVVATAQRGSPPKVLVWSSTTLKVLASLPLANGSRAGSAITFSSCGKFLAVAAQDEEHEVFIFEWAVADGRLISETPTGPGKVLSIAWSWRGNRILVGTVDGFAAWSEANTRNPNIKKGLFGKISARQAIFSSAFVAASCEQIETESASDYAVVGTANGGVFRVDDETGRSLASGSRQHRGPVSVLRSCAPLSPIQDSDGGVPDVRSVALISGGFDGKIKLYSSDLEVRIEIDLARYPDKYCLVRASVSSVCFNSDRRKLLVGTCGSEILELSTADESDINGGPLVTGHCVGKLNALAMHPVLPEIATAGDDMTLRTWDTQTHVQLRKLDLEDVSRAIAYSPNGHLIGVGLGSSVVATAKTGHVMIVSTLKAYLEVAKDLKTRQCSPIVALEFSPNGELLAAATHGCLIEIFDCLNKFEIKTVCTAHMEPPAAIDFSEDSRYLGSCSAGPTLFETYTFDTSTGELKLVEDESSKSCPPEDISWSTWTKTTGAPVTGIVPAFAELSDVSTTHRSSDFELVATGDDFGRVKLFRWPCAEPLASAKTYYGHASRVAAVRFGPDSNVLASVGLEDCCLFQWRRRRHGTHEPVLRKGDEVDTTGSHELVVPVEGNISSANADDRLENAMIRETAVDGNLNARNSTITFGPMTAPARKDGARLVHAYGISPQGGVAYNAHNDVIHAIGRLCVLSSLRDNGQHFFEGCTREISTLAVSHDGDFCVAAEVGSPTLHIFDAITMTTVAQLPVRLRAPIALAAMSASLVAAIGSGPERTLAVWASRPPGNWHGADHLASVPLPFHTPRFIALSSGGDSFDVAVGGLGECGAANLQCFKLVGRTLVCLRVQSDNARSIFVAGTCVEGSLVVAADSDGGLEVWGISDKSADKVVVRLLRESTAHTAAVQCVAYAPSGQCVTAGLDGWVKIWTAATLEPVAAFSLDRPLVVVAADSSLSRLAAVTTDSCLCEIVVDSGARAIAIRGHQGAIQALAVAPVSGTRRLVATCADNGVIKVWDVQTYALLVETELGYKTRAMAWSPDGAALAVGAGDGAPIAQNDGMFVVFKLSDASLEPIVSEHNAKAYVTVLRYSPDGNVLALGSNDAILYLYAVQSATSYHLYACFDKHVAPVTALDFSTNARYIRSVSSTQSLCFCESLGGDAVAPEDCSDEDWASETCLSGTTGEVGPCADASENITVLARSTDKTKLTVCTSAGFLRFYGYPTVEPQHMFDQPAHAAAVTAVEYATPTEFFTTGKDALLLHWSYDVD